MVLFAQLFIGALMIGLTVLIYSIVISKIMLATFIVHIAFTARKRIQYG